GWVPGFTWAPAWVDWYYGYPYPIAPLWRGRPWRIAPPPGVTIAHPVVTAHVLTPRLDVAARRLYARHAGAPAGARLVTPPNMARAGFAARPAQATFAGAGRPGAGAWGARPVGPAAARPYGAPATPARPYSAAPAAPARSYAPAPARVAP